MTKSIDRLLMMPVSSWTNFAVSKVGEAVTRLSFTYLEWLPGAVRNVSVAYTSWPCSPSLPDLSHGVRQSRAGDQHSHHVVL